MSAPTRLDDYIPFVGEEVIDQIRLMVRSLRGAHLQHVSSTRTGGGVAEILSRVVPLMNDMGLKTEWTVIDAPDAFFDATKSFHNALHGVAEDITPDMFRIYREVMKENASKINKDADYIIIHDPQPMGLIEDRPNDRAKWTWRCHIDVAQADLRVWAFLKPYLDLFDAAVFHIPQFLRRDLFIPQYLIPPFIDPLSDKNRDLRPEEIQTVLDRYNISSDKPFILQASRFDWLKDPMGTLRAYEMVKRSTDVAFVFVGNVAPDDPEGRVVCEEVVKAAEALPDTTVIVNPEDNDITVNALQRAAALVIQKSLREGFGLSITEPMWKAKPVVGGDTGGISYQVIDGVTGFLVQTAEGAAYRMRQLLSNPPLAELMGQEARLRVKGTFLPPHYLHNWLGLLLGFQYPERGVSVLPG